MMEIMNKKLDEGTFFKLQSEVLKQWPTGRDVNFEEAVTYHRTIPRKKIFSFKLNEAKQQGKTLIQPRAGVALVDEHIRLLKYLEEQGEADLLPTTIDSYTRQTAMRRLRTELMKVKWPAGLFKWFPGGELRCRGLQKGK